jgi:hypothetical protein
LIRDAPTPGAANMMNAFRVLTVPFTGILAFQPAVRQYATRAYPR